MNGRIQLVLCKRNHKGHKTERTVSSFVLASSAQDYAERTILKGVHHANRREVLEDFYGDSIHSINAEDFSLNY